MTRKHRNQFLFCYHRWTLLSQYCETGFFCNYKTRPTSILAPLSAEDWILDVQSYDFNIQKHVCCARHHSPLLDVSELFSFSELYRPCPASRSSGSSWFGGQMGFGCRQPENHSFWKSCSNKQQHKYWFLQLNSQQSKSFWWTLRLYFQQHLNRRP